MVSTEMRSNVEQAFQRQVPDEHGGLAARESFVEMLEALGLNKSEANALINECDPGGQSHLKYRDFLDFIFEPGLGELKCDQSVDPKTSKADSQEAKKPELVLESSPKTSDAPQNGLTEPKDSKEGTVVTTPQVQHCKIVEDPKKNEADEKTVEKTKDEKPTEDKTKEEKPKEKEEKKVLATPTKKKKPMRKCSTCSEPKAELFKDPHDHSSYCEQCWINWYGSPPNKKGPALVIPTKIVSVVKGRLWPEDELIAAWRANPIKGWPGGPYSQRPAQPLNDGIPEFFAPVYVRLDPGLVGSHARLCSQVGQRPFVGELLCQRYTVKEVVGAGHFTRAILAHDKNTGTDVCVKKHNSITIELLTDLLTISHRLHHVDPDCVYFPRIFDAFYEIDGYTVESLITGKNCLLVARTDPEHFKDFDNMRIVAKQGYTGLVYMEKAGVVHCDLKPDNIMWIESPDGSSEPTVKLVDFGCSRLDSRLESGRNWALAEGGAGHVGKWAPEMILRLKITHKADVWGLAVALLELYCCRSTWCGEADTVEVVLAQTLGLTNSRGGLPADLLRESPLDIVQLYSPNPEYFPLQRFGTYRCGASFYELRPTSWGHGIVLGDEETWDEEKIIFSTFCNDAMVLHYNKRPTAEEMLTRAFTSPSEEANRATVEAYHQKKKEEAEARARAEEAERLKREAAEAKARAEEEERAKIAAAEAQARAEEEAKQQQSAQAADAFSWQRMQAEAIEKARLLSEKESVHKAIDEFKEEEQKASKIIEEKATAEAVKTAEQSKTNSVDICDV